MQPVLQCQRIDTPTHIYTPLHEEHIEAARNHLPNRLCPVELALQYAAPCNVLVGVNDGVANFYVYDRVKPIRRFVVEGLQKIGNSVLSPEVREFIRRYDAGLPVSPLFLDVAITY